MKLPDHWFYGHSTRDPAIFSFDAEEVLHATRALRLSVGDGLQWLDGLGGRFTGSITEVARAGFTAFAKTRHTEAPPPMLQLGVGTLHDATRLEWLVEKATELGVTEILLLDTQRVQRTRHRLPRLEMKALGAVKQSGRAWLPSVREISFNAALELFAEQDSSAELRLLAHCYDDQHRTPLWEVLAKASESKPVATSEWVRLLIGPEGDFARDEVAALEALGFLSTTLGEARLRSETAAIAALSLLSLSPTR